MVEIIKRKMEGSLHQYTQLGSVTTTEQWDPVEGKDMDRYVHGEGYSSAVLVDMATIEWLPRNGPQSSLCTFQRLPFRIWKQHQGK